MDKKVIAECSVDGSQAFSSVSDNYGWACVLSYSSHVLGRSHAVFPSYAQAKIAASWAIKGNLGGYSDVEVNETSRSPDFNTAEEWLFD